MRLALGRWVWIYLGYLEADKIKGAVLDSEVNPSFTSPFLMNSEYLRYRAVNGKALSKNFY